MARASAPALTLVLSPLPLLSWRRESRLPGLILVLVVEAVLVVFLFVVVAKVVIPLAAPPVGVPSVTPTAGL